MLAAEHDLLLALALLAALGVLVLVPALVSPTRFVLLGVLRQVKAMLMAEIVLEVGVMLLVMLLGGLDASSDHAARESSSTCIVPLLLPTFIGLLVASGRSPFDLPEAESEIVAGAITELGAVAFSFVLLADQMELLA